MSLTNGYFIIYIEKLKKKYPAQEKISLSLLFYIHTTLCKIKVYWRKKLLNIWNIPDSVDTKMLDLNYAGINSAHDWHGYINN